MKMAPLAGLIATVSLFAAPVAFAGPSCVDRQGAMARCGTQGAMPVGWSPPPEVARAHADAMDSRLDVRGEIGLICVIGGLFALLALLPDFDGGWDHQEDDRERRG